MTALAHILVILVGGLVLEVSIGLGLSIFEYLVGGILGGASMEAVAIIAERLLIKPQSGPG